MPAYTAIAEAGMAIVELLRSQMTPEPISKPELIGLCLPYEPEDYQLTVYLYHIEQSAESQAGYVREGKTLQRLAPLTLNLNFLITAHSKRRCKTARRTSTGSSAGRCRSYATRP